MHVTEELERLVASADQAYQRARVEVYDALPPQARVDAEILTRRQRAALSNLVAAEAELANYRHRCYVGSA
jgi:hypothetical protein